MSSPAAEEAATGMAVSVCLFGQIYTLLIQFEGKHTTVTVEAATVTVDAATVTVTGAQAPDPGTETAPTTPVGREPVPLPLPVAVTASTVIYLVEVEVWV